MNQWVRAFTLIWHETHAVNEQSNHGTPYFIRMKIPTEKLFLGLISGGTWNFVSWS